MNQISSNTEESQEKSTASSSSPQQARSIFLSKISNAKLASLFDKALEDGQARLSNHGALIVETGEFTGRAATKRFVIAHPELKSNIYWGKFNQEIEPKEGLAFLKAVEEQFLSRKSFEYQGFVGPFQVQVKSPSAWHIAFAQNMFRESSINAVATQIKNSKKIEILHLPFDDARKLGTGYPDKTAIVIDLVQQKIAIVGTAYAGEIKKSAFGMANYLLPEHGILPMHSSANCLSDGTNSCVLFGLSGTGKTTLSASADRALIGDDEIVWTKTGISNLEGGCYAKLIHLDPKKEPEIYEAVNQPGAILENIVYDSETLEVDFDDASKTENTRGSYSLDHLSQVFTQDREASAPKHIVFLTADAFGALPPVARLNPYQAQYHFMSGYTAKVAGTEIGVKEPQATFSACFGAPFMPRHPKVYAAMLMESAKQNQTEIWLLNTGWQEGGYGKAERFPIPVSRQILSAIQSGELSKAKMTKHPVFGFEVPESCPGLESKWLKIPEGEVVAKLAKRFVENIESLGQVPDEVKKLGGPIL